MRPPLVRGVAGGVGTTTIAAALQAHDGGVYRGGPVDVVVCRSTAVSLNAAHQVINAAAGTPVLVVVADGPLRAPAAARARIRMVEPHVTAVVRVPYVTQWRESDQALKQAIGVLRQPANPPKWLRAWSDAVKQLADAVLPLLDRPPAMPGSKPDVGRGADTSTAINGLPVTAPGPGPRPAAPLRR